MENKQEFKKYFKKLFINDIYINKNFNQNYEIDEETFKHIIKNKSEFIFFISIILFSKKIITNNKMPKHLKKNKYYYTLEEFTSEILFRKYSPSSYTSRKTIFSKIVFEILELDAIEFSDYSDKVYKKLLTKILEYFKNGDNIISTKNKKKKKEKDMYTEQDLGDFLKM